MRRIGRPQVNRGVGEHRTIVIRVRGISVIARRVDVVPSKLGLLDVTRRRFQAQLRSPER